MTDLEACEWVAMDALAMSDADPVQLEYINLVSVSRADARRLLVAYRDGIRAINQGGTGMVELRAAKTLEEKLGIEDHWPEY